MGLANHKFFLLFLLYINLISVYAIALVVGHFWACLSLPFFGTCADASLGDSFNVLGLCMCALIFGLFTCCMMFDQSASVLTGATQIDRYQRSSGAGETVGKDERARALAEVFGGDPARDGFQIHWLLPTPIVYRDPETLTGFCFKNTPKPRNAEELESLM